MGLLNAKALGKVRVSGREKRGLNERFWTRQGTVGARLAQGPVGAQGLGPRGHTSFISRT